MSAQIIDGASMASQIKKEVKQYTDMLTKKPCLAVVLCGNDPASQIYVNKKIKTCEEVGIESKVIRLFEESEPCMEQLLKEITRLNEDNEVHGILVQLPLPKGLDRNKVFDCIHPLKDVDVVSPENVGLLLQGRPRYKPCTPAGIQYMLWRSGIEICGKKICIINRSDIVGKPLLALLSQDQNMANGTCILCHDRTPPEILQELTLSSDIVIVAVGIKDFLKPDMVKENAVIIDVGINRLENSKKIVGDSCYDELLKKVSHITPVPGGVGPMTVAMLLHNTITAYENQI